MSGFSRYAILLDGGFVLKKLQRHLNRFPTAEDIDQVCRSIRSHPHVQELDLLRIYFYHAPPAKDEIVNPIDQTPLRLARTTVFTNHRLLLRSLELRSNFALRLGETVVHDWRIGSQAMVSLMRTRRPIGSGDLVPNIIQKGVDLRIGLDIARLALRELVGSIVVATGDSDLIPAFKFARREGLRVYLNPMGHGIRRELKAHADDVLEIPLSGVTRTIS